MSDRILPGHGMHRVAYVTTANTGGSLELYGGPEGSAALRRVDPHGVLLVVRDQELFIEKPLLPMIGRYFMAAAILLGQDINEGWDSPEQTVMSEQTETS